MCVYVVCTPAILEREREKAYRWCVCVLVLISYPSTYIHIHSKCSGASVHDQLWYGHHQLQAFVCHSQCGFCANVICIRNAYHSLAHPLMYSGETYLHVVSLSLLGGRDDGVVVVDIVPFHFDQLLMG